jgi:aminoglycoside phosphotransferase (APT) family kinase protein
VPRLVDEDERHRVQVRERLHGLMGDDIEPRLFGGSPPDAWTRLADAPISPFGERLAASYGELAKRIRTAVSVDAAKTAGITLCPRRELDVDAAIDRLQATSASRAAKLAAERARDWLAAIPAADAVIHADLHFFNLCCAEDGTIVGLFDLDGAGIDAAATELLYVHALGPRFVAIALDAYGAIDDNDVRRAHARIALDHLRWHGPDSVRHEAIVGWVTAVFEQLVP